MPIPNLLHPIRVVIRRQDRASTDYDDDAREAIQTVKKFADQPIQAQISYAGANKSEKKLEVNRRGKSDKGAGYILLRTFDLNALGFDVEVNDQIVQIGFSAVDVWIHEIEPAAHYPETGGASLLRCHFKDRKPARNNPGE